MEMLFRAKTVRQRKIMEWLAAQKVTREDVARAELRGPGLVRITNPAGAYMDLLCDWDHTVTILKISPEREGALNYCWENETEDPKTREWRNELTSEEQALVNEWDDGYENGLPALSRDILKAERQNALVITQNEAEAGIRKVAVMEPVASITGNEFAKGEIDLIAQVTEFFASLGNQAHSPQLGDVVLDRKGVKADLGHGIGRKKAAAFAAVPKVLEQGLVIDYQKNWKGRGYDTAAVAAPVTIGGEHYLEGIVLTRSRDTNRFYVHEVLATANGAPPFKTGAFIEGVPGGDAPSILNLLQKVWAVKTELSQSLSMAEQLAAAAKEAQQRNQERQAPAARRDQEREPV